MLSATGEEESVQSYLKKSSLWLTQRKDSEEPVHRNKLQNWNFSERCVSMFCTSDRYILMFFWVFKNRESKDKASIKNPLPSGILVGFKDDRGN